MQRRFARLGAPGVVAGAPQYADRFGWPVDDLGTPAIDWADGDDTSPAQGPTLTKIGSPVAGGGTPQTKYDGTPITCTSFAENEHYRSATLTDPGAGDDMVIAAFFRTPATTTGYVVSTFTSTSGWTLFYTSNSVRFTSDDGSAQVNSVASWDPKKWSLASVTYDASGDQYLYYNGVLVDNDDASGQGVLTGEGVGINATPGGGLDRASCIVRAVAWYGTNLAATADAAWHAQLAKAVGL